MNAVDRFDKAIEWVEASLHVRAKDGSVVPLRRNKPQRIIAAAMREQLAKGRPIRAIILKARQEGCSTFTQAMSWERVRRVPGQRALTLAHAMDGTQTLRGMVRGWESTAKGKLKANNESRIRFKHGSSARFHTVGGKAVGRSQTVNFLHLSEAAFYGDPDNPQQHKYTMDQIGGVMGTVSDDIHSVVVIESTANGIGGMFYDYWVGATRNENEYVPIFVPWFAMEEYSRTLQYGPITSEEDLTLKERELAAAYNLTLEQINWRRWTIRSRFMGDERHFRQEYPANAEEAFMVSGSPVFDPDWIAANLSRTPEPVWTGDIQLIDPEQRAFELVEAPC